MEMKKINKNEIKTSNTDWVESKKHLDVVAYSNKTKSYKLALKIGEYEGFIWIKETMLRPVKARPSINKTFKYVFETEDETYEITGETLIKQLNEQK